jgi:2-C-methyl-D-erythritol 2,4-cyclodiphosphate synthase
MEIRVGHGIDIHPFKEGRALVIGGVKINHHQGLDGHSDADVLLHAVMDALLGAAGKDDIGHYFPPSDVAWKGIESSKMVEKVMKIIADEEGWIVNNCDCMLLVEKPRLSEYVSEMKKNISALLNISIKSCCIKVSTTEKLGFIGRGEGVMASVTILLRR